MRRVGRGALFSAVALTALLAFGATTASAVVNPRASGKKVRDKKMAHTRLPHQVRECRRAGDSTPVSARSGQVDGGTKAYGELSRSRDSTSPRVHDDDLSPLEAVDASSTTCW
jgi:hypothetical protein